MNDFFHFGAADNLGPYNSQLKCNSAAWLDKKGAEVDKGGKIILPASALMHLTRLHIQFPMLFKLTNKSKNRSTHCGVLEFVAPEGKCFLPYWMMRNLLLSENDIVHVEYVNLQIARFAKFQPQSVDFLEISNPKAVLENSLRNFATLTKGDIISIFYNDKEYELLVLETRPGNAVSIIECDMDVDFAAPLGYEEPKYNKPEQPKLNEQKDYSKYIQKKGNNIPYAGEGYRLDGKTKKPEQNQQIIKNTSTASTSTSSATANLQSTELEQRGIPNYEYVIGTLSFNRNPSKKDDLKAKEEANQKPKEIKGQKLKHIGLTSTQ